MWIIRGRGWSRVIHGRTDFLSHSGKRVLNLKTVAVVVKRLLCILTWVEIYVPFLGELDQPKDFVTFFRNDEVNLFCNDRVQSSLVIVTLINKFFAH